MSEEDERYCVSNLAEEISGHKFKVEENLFIEDRDWRVQFIRKKEPGSDDFEKSFIVGVNIYTGEVCFVSDAPTGEPHRFQEYIDSAKSDPSKMKGFREHFRRNMENYRRRMGLTVFP